jgi:methylated-DNA-[protein]-cysteine S-methyltransferase
MPQKLLRHSLGCRVNSSGIKKKEVINKMYYQIINVSKESIGIVWQNIGGKPQIERIFLPSGKAKLISEIEKEFPAINEKEQKIPGKTATQIAELYAGKKAKFDFSILNLKKLSGFSAKVLKETCKIPHGKVGTYSGLATKVGSPRAVRAVGTALANNPFPLVIPCHRVVRADGSLGGFGGGIKMKKELLSREGIKTDKKGYVAGECFDI